MPDDNLPQRFPPTLESQEDATLARLGRSVVLDRLKAQALQARWLSSVDVEAEVKEYLSGLASPSTRKSYAFAIGVFRAWCQEQKVHPLAISPGTADLYAQWLMDTQGSASSVQIKISGASAWLTWLERRHPVKNPFPGSRVRPTKAPATKLEYPNGKDLRMILLWCPPNEGAAVAAMAFRGLRVGALPSLSIHGRQFRALSKGSWVSGELPDSVLDFIREAGLDPQSPFAGTSAEQWQSRLKKRMTKLYKAKLIRGAYSAHDLRHHYASQEYKKDRSIRRVSMLLGHSNIAMTERYVHQQLGL